MNVAAWQRWADDGGPPGEAPEPELPRMTREKLREFVMGWCDGWIFSSWHLEQRHEGRLLTSVFTILALGGAALLPEDHEEVGLIWEWISHPDGGRTTFPMGINGMPMFLSCRFMHRLDWARACDAINAENDRRKATTV